VKKIRTVFLVMFMFLSFRYAALGNLLMGIELKHTDYILFESIEVAVTIINDTDKPMEFSRSRAAADINLVVHKQNNEFIFKKVKDKIVTDVTIMPDGRETIVIDLIKWYPINKQGKYFISAEVEWNGKIYRTEKKVIDVVSGIEMAKVVRRLPGANASERVYTLRYWQRERQENIFLVVEDPAMDYHYGVFDLGPIVRVMKPTLEVDRHGNVTVIHQSGINRITETTLFSDADEVIYVGQIHRLIRTDGATSGGC